MCLCVFCFPSPTPCKLPPPTLSQSKAAGEWEASYTNRYHSQARRPFPRSLLFKGGDPKKAALERREGQQWPSRAVLLNLFPMARMTQSLLPPPILFREMNKAGLEKGPFSYGIWSGNTFPSVDIQEVLQ